MGFTFSIKKIVLLKNEETKNKAIVNSDGQNLKTIS